LRDGNGWEVDEEYDHGNLIDAAEDPGDTHPEHPQKKVHT
jgi:hypothetical protein